MDSSPKGREITTLYGDAGTIIARGNQVTTLGDQMISSAALLKNIAEGASGQKGLAVDKLQEVVGDCYEELALAGQRYKPTGPVLVTYGQVIAEVQPLIKRAVDNCEADWRTFAAKRNDLWAAQTAPQTATRLVLPDASPEPQVDERQEAIEDAQASAGWAYDAWTAEAQTFDAHYDTWEAAFDKAAADIGEATDGGIEDSRWDDLDGFVAGALEVLKWVGLALAVVGLIIGGPFIAALAAIVAIATLVLTIYSFSRGNSSGWDLAFAIVGVIPFGSIGKLANNKIGFMDDVAGGLLTSAGRGEIVAEFASVGAGASAGVAASQGGKLAKFFSGLRGAGSGLAANNGIDLGNFMTRLFMGKSANDLFDPAMAGQAIHGMDGLSIILGTWQTQGGHMMTMVELLGGKD